MEKKCKKEKKVKTDGEFFYVQNSRFFTKKCIANVKSRKNKKKVLNCLFVKAGREKLLIEKLTLIIGGFYQHIKQQKIEKQNEVSGERTEEIEEVFVFN